MSNMRVPLLAYVLCLLLVVFGTAVELESQSLERALSKGAEEYYNHAQAYLGSQTIVNAKDPSISQEFPGHRHINPLNIGNFVLVNLCHYDLYLW